MGPFLSPGKSPSPGHPPGGITEEAEGAQGRGGVGSENILEVRIFVHVPEADRHQTGPCPLGPLPRPKKNLKRKSRQRSASDLKKKKKNTSRATHTSQITGTAGPFPILSLGKAGLTGFSRRLNNSFLAERGDVTGCLLGQTWVSERAI